MGFTFFPNKVTSDAGVFYSFEVLDDDDDDDDDGLS
jgi:hypothetical protein